MFRTCSTPAEKLLTWTEAPSPGSPSHRRQWVPGHSSLSWCAQTLHSGLSKQQNRSCGRSLFPLVSSESWTCRRRRCGLKGDSTACPKGSPSKIVGPNEKMWNVTFGGWHQPCSAVFLISIFTAFGAYISFPLVSENVYVQVFLCSEGVKSAVTYESFHSHLIEVFRNTGALRH